MRNLLDRSISKGQKQAHAKRNQDERVVQLRLQSRWATFLLLSPFLFAVHICWPILHDEPVASLYLLPALLVTVHFVFFLNRHLTSNHPPSQSGHLLSTLGVANWATVLRAGAVVLLAGFLPIAFASDSGVLDPINLAWVGGIIYLVISLFDLLDGYIARNHGCETVLGRQLDIETDAAGLLVASLLAVALDRLPVAYLCVGLAYYPFVFGIWLRKRKKLPLVSLQSRPYARIIAGFQMGLVTLALMPIFKTLFTHLAAFIFMVPFLIGFIRDWLVVSCRLTTNGAQKSSADLWIRSRLLPLLPLVFRLVIILSGAGIVAQGTSLQIHFTWHVVLCLGIILAAIGCIGRIGALVLILLLGSNNSPYGTTILSMTLFISGAALLLSGTGRLSIYSPEDAILYRHRKKTKQKV